MEDGELVHGLSAHALVYAPGARTSMKPAELQALLDRLAAEVRPYAAHGRVADYIPALASVDASRFGIAFATVDGEVVGSGDFETRFSIQSVSKAFALALVFTLLALTAYPRAGAPAFAPRVDALLFQLEGFELPASTAALLEAYRRGPGAA